MGWTAPATWAVNEIVTAAKMNTHIRDNLLYLKGDAGSAVAIDNAMTVAGGIQATDAAANQQLILTGAGTNQAYIGNHITQNSLLIGTNRNPSTGTFDNAAKSHAELRLNGDGTASFIQLMTAAAANTAATERMRVAGNGSIGLGTNNPQSPLHAYQSNGGFMFYNASGIGGTAVTVIPDGAGDVVQRIAFFGVVQCSAGASPGVLQSLVSLTPGNNQNIDVNAAADRLQVQLAANGALTLQRTVGSNSFSVTFLFCWI